ncbi:MAG: M14 family zinc carboxypeptidase [Phycisphaerae bacterium]
MRKADRLFGGADVRPAECVIQKMGVSVVKRKQVRDRSRAGAVSQCQPVVSFVAAASALAVVTAPAAGQYHTHAQIGSDLLAVENNYPAICERHNLGLSVLGRELWAINISDNVGVEEDEPEFKFVSTMHGDEIMGVELCMNLIDYLTTNYGTDSRVTNIVDSIDVWIVPLMNPDGYERSPRRRYNENGEDLNRNFPDVFNSPSNTTDGREPETAVIMEWSFGRSFSLAANIHGGALVANYPYDGNAAGQSIYTASPDDDLYIYVAELYSQQNIPMWNSPVFFHGITNGADWYHINGGMQDWNYRYMGCNAITLELHNEKQPPASQIPTFWNDNRESMLSYMETCLIGVRGLVTDATTGGPVAATIRVVGRDHESFTDPEIGDYHRMLLPGTYDLTFEADGYDPHTIEDVVVTSGDAVREDVPLWRTLVSYPNGGETLVTGGSTLITWTGNPDAQFHVQYSANANDIGSTTDGFETGSFDPEYTNDSSHPWAIVNNPTHQGLYAAKAGTITHSQETALTRQASGGVASFWYNVSSESGWDFFRFYVDDVVVHSDSGTSGGWEFFTTTIDPGLHELKWEYSKDSNTTHGSDTVWVDDIRLTTDNTVWTDITTATPLGATSTSWTPGEEGTDYKVRVRSVLAGGLYGQWDESDSTFAVGPEEIPTVSEWGLAVLTLLICTAGSLVLLRQRSEALLVRGTVGFDGARRRNRNMTDKTLLFAMIVGLGGLGAAACFAEEPSQRPATASINQTGTGSTPLHLAARSLRLESAKALVQAGADVKAVDGHGATPLHLALRAGDDTEKAQAIRLELVELLLDRGADVNAADDQGKTPLHMAAMRGRAKLLDRLVEAGAVLTARDQFGRAPLHDAAMYDQLAVIDWLVAHDVVDLDVRDKQGRTPLHCAVMRYRKKAAEKLIELGATFDAKDSRGATPLHLTATEGPDEPEVNRMMTEVAKVLITKGADVDARDRAGKTPLDHAISGERNGLATLLRQHGATD